ncbi:hypothetical protein NKH10_31625 [Mesorhizobium sp. M1340]|uniref:hypothetical protein n=1 Tax=unclassified Mesorhizobium TaxID=325217 RepID=UPI0033370557
MSPFGGIDPDPLALQRDATLKAIRQYLAPFYKWRQAEIVAAAEPLMPGHQAFIRIINRRDQARPLIRLFVASTLISAQRALDITRAHLASSPPLYTGRVQAWAWPFRLGIRVRPARSAVPRSTLSC